MKLLVTGGGGFIGSHVAEAYARQGHEVIVLDNLSRAHLLGRPDRHAHYTWNELKGVANVALVEGSVRDRVLVREVVSAADAIVHAAAQTAVTTSVVDPVTDFETNVIGAFEVLEAARATGRAIPFVFTSTNKVYGNNVNRLPIVETARRYDFGASYENGVSESLPVDGCEHTPYGASKLAADLYVQEYAHLYRLPTAVFRMSCVYGPRQFGVEDQGWLAHFVISVLTGAPITIYGDGRQVRDVLYIDDLVKAIQSFFMKATSLSAGVVCNVGGGRGFTLSLLELLDLLERQTGRRGEISFAPSRPSDQRVYVSDVRRIGSLLGWTPETPPTAGVQAMIRWVSEHLELFSSERHT
jgi:CDP-paratose 2-epimerase